MSQSGRLAISEMSGTSPDGTPPGLSFVLTELLDWWYYRNVMEIDMDWWNTFWNLDWQSVWVQVQSVPAYAWVIIVLLFLLWRRGRQTRKAYAALERTNRDLTKLLARTNDHLAAVANRCSAKVESVVESGSGVK